MQIIKSPKKLQILSSVLKKSGKTIGLVPTMGALHEGHLSLVRAARKQNDIVITSIFVNPLQFGPNEDFSRYPRMWLKDKQSLSDHRVDYLFAPTAKDLFDSSFQSTLSVGKETLQNKLCGLSRPGHFDGVTTIVAKLFHLAQADRAYFGQKDFQQSRIIEQMVSDMDFPLKIKVLPVVREKTGLAMSSRNQYLNDEQRERALIINRTLKEMKRRLLNSKESLFAVKSWGQRQIKAKVEKLDYLEIVDFETLTALENRNKKMVIVVAAFVGQTRLIDNVIMKSF